MTEEKQRSVRITDTSLRDGSHAMSHQFTAEQVREVAGALDKAGVQVIECNHGDGLAGSSIQYGFSKVPEMDLISEATSVCEQARIAALLLPGVGTVEQLKEAVERGIGVLRIATHCTEADISQQHFEMAKEMDLEAIGFLMMAHMRGPKDLLEQAKLMESYGAHCVYVTDSGGRLLMNDVRDRIRAYREVLDESTQIGIHAHENLSLSVANSVVAVEAGVRRVDASLAGQGAGAGNCPIEPFIAVADLLGWKHRCDVFALQDAADDIVRPLRDRPVQVDRETLTLGYAGVYSSFLRHAERAAQEYGVDARDLLLEVGRRGLVGGQEDMIVDIALDLTRERPS